MTDQIVTGSAKLNTEDRFYTTLLDAVEHNLSLHSVDDKIFKVDVEGRTGKTLFEHYLELFPLEERQQYRCATCRRWLDKYGQYVTIKNGVTRSLAFHVDIEVDAGGNENIYSFMASLARIVEKSPVVDLVVENEKDFSIKSTNPDFHHLHGTLQCTNDLVLFKLPEAERLEKEALAREDVRIVKSNIRNWSDDVLQRAYELFEHGELKHAEKFKKSFMGWYSLYKEVRATKNVQIANNLIWEAVDSTRQDLIHFNTTVVGTFLDGLSHYSEAYAIRRFRTQTEGVNYMRATEKPTEQELDKAKAKVAELGLESAFKRRFGTVEEIQYWLWKAPEATATVAETSTVSIFDNLKTKDSTAKPAAKSVDGGQVSVMTFVNEILPKVKTLALTFPDGPYTRANFAQLVGPTDPESKPILRWDSEEKRNALSSYVYHQGSTLSKWTEEDLSTPFTVTGITTNPSRWADPELKYGVPTEGIIFILDNFADREGKSVALFAEDLRHELRDIRRVVEEYSKTTALDEPTTGTKAAGLSVINNGKMVQEASGRFGIAATMQDGSVVNYALSIYF